MSLTITGLIIIFLGMILVFLPNKYLVAGTIFSIPFTATAILNFSSGFWLAPYQFFILLLIVKKSIYSMNNKKLFIPRNSRVPILLLLIFQLVVLLSMLMPVVINGDLYITRLVSEGIPSGGHYATYRTITTTIYLSFGIISSILLSSEINSFQKLKFALRVHISSGVFVASWGYLQFLLFTFGIPYPSFIFNNSSNVMATGFTQTVYNEGASALNTSLRMTRISSVATEPSIFAQYLLTILPMLFFCFLLNKKIFTKKYDFFILLYILILLLISTSSSGYAGLLASFLFIFVALAYFRLINFRHAITMSLLIFAILFLYISSPVVQDVFNIFILGKLQSGSGLERTSTLNYAYEYWSKYPILGIGWGSVTVFDLFLNILANTGLLGLLSFLSPIIFLIVGITKSINKKKYQLNMATTYKKGILESTVIYISIVISFVTLLFVLSISGFSYAYGMFWYLLALLISTHSILRTDLQSANGSSCAT